MRGAYLRGSAWAIRAAVLAGTTARAQEPGEKYALLVGVDQYAKAQYR
jgi:hypothetical protein